MGATPAHFTSQLETASRSNSVCMYLCIHLCKYENKSVMYWISPTQNESFTLVLLIKSIV